MKNKLKIFGELMDDFYYLLSPIILSKLFLFTMVITNQKGIIIFLTCLLLMIVCYSTSMYRLHKKYLKKEVNNNGNII